MDGIQQGTVSVLSLIIVLLFFMEGRRGVVGERPKGVGVVWLATWHIWGRTTTLRFVVLEYQWCVCEDIVLDHTQIFNDN